jgi:PAS domain S-box-containing protein
MKKRLYIILILALLTFGVFFIAMHSFKIQQQVQEDLVLKFSELQKSVNQRLGDSVESKLDDIELELNLFREVEEVESGEPDVCSQKLQELHSNSTAILNNVSRVDSKGYFYCSSTDAGTGIDGSKYAYIQKILNDPEHKAVISEPFLVENNDSKRVVMAIHVPVYTQEGVFDGILGGSFYVDDLVTSFSGNEVLPDDSWVVVMRIPSGEVLYHPDSSLLSESIYGEVASELLSKNLELKRILDTAMTQDNSQVKYHTFKGTYNLGSVTHINAIENYSWSILTTSPLEPVYASVSHILRSQRILFMVFILIMSASLAALIYLLYRWSSSLESQVKEKTTDLQNQKAQLEESKMQLQLALKKQDTTQEDLESHVKDMEKQQEAMLNVLEDIDEEKKVSQGLASELEKYKLATDSASDHIVITDKEGTVLYANKAVEKITGFSAKDIMGKKAGSKDLWGGLMPKEFYDKLWKTIKKDKKSFTGEITNKRKNGEKYSALSTISPVLDKKGEIRYFVGIERDITKEKEVDRMKTEFISIASHQLRTPLSAMKWFLEMLLNGDAGELSKEQKDYIQNVDESNERMIDLVNSLLNVSRIESGRIIIDPKETDLSELVASIIKELKPKFLEKDIKSVFSANKKLKRINIDPKLIRNVYLNLISNAIKYSNKGGEVTVMISKKDNKVVSQVSDTGMGIPTKEQDKIFTKFYRATNARQAETEGNGLGLYLVKSIVESSGGKIWFKSQKEKGTSFFFTLPTKGSKAKKGEVSIDT